MKNHQMNPHGGERKPTLSISVLIVLLCLILCSSLLLTGSAFFFNSRDIMIEQYRESVEKQISIYLDGLEDKFKAIEKVQKNLLIDSDVLYLKSNNITSFNFDIASATNRILSQIETIKVGNNYLKNVSVHFDKLDRTLSTDRITFTELNRNYVRMILGTKGSNIKYYDNTLHMVSLPSTVTDSSDFICCIESTLDRGVILSDLREFHVSEHSQSALLFDDFGYYIPSSQKIYNLLRSRDLQGIQRLVLDGKPHIVIQYSSQALHSTYYQLIPEEEVLADVNKLSGWFLFFGSLVSLLTVVYCVILYRTIKKPMDVLIGAFSKVEEGDFSVKLSHRNIREFSNIYAGFNLMTEKLKYLIDNVYVQKILKQKAELRQLQAQINPHFLYNSFFILKKRISAGQYEDAKNFADMLGVYFKYVTKNHTDSCRLSEEVGHAKTYAAIQSIRFRDRISVEWEELPQQFMELQVPRLILQPILENAFKYGLEDLEFDGLLRISFAETEELLLIRVEDNSEGFQANFEKISLIQQAIEENRQEGDISGLLNISRRLQLFYGDPKFGLSLSQSELGGLLVVIRLPKDFF